MTSRYTNLSLTELEAEQAALECALQAKRALDTLLAIDGELYGAPPHIKQGDSE
jgi:hypothetical protein